MAYSSNSVCLRLIPFILICRMLSLFWCCDVSGGVGGGCTGGSLWLGRVCGECCGGVLCCGVVCVGHFHVSV